jgi:transcriptional regulator with XRE-family HTH domain
MSLGDNLSKRLKELRGNRSQDWLAKEIDVSRVTVNRWENHGGENVTIAELEALSRVLETSIEDLLGLESKLVMTSHDVVNFLRKALNDTHAREGMIKAMGEMAWDKGEFGLSPVKRSLIERLPSLDDSQAAHYLSLIDVELTGRLPDEGDSNQYTKLPKNKAK